MNFRERDLWAGLAGVAFLTVIGVVVAAVVLAIPVVIAGIGLLTRLQSALIDRALASFCALSGWQFDSGSLVIRLVAAVTTCSALAFGLYFLLFVGSNIETIVIFTGSSAVLGVLLTLASSLRPDAPADHLSSLRFWD